MRLFFRSWFLLPFSVLVLVMWMQSVRLNRVRQLTALPQWSVDAPVRDSTSATGYAHGLRSLIVSDNTGQSQQWIAQTQAMLHRGAWQVRRVDYDNAPFGRETHLPGIYRAWLGVLAMAHAGVTGEPSGIAVERVALYADPLLQLGLFVLTGWFIRRSFGTFAALVAGMALLTLYPLSTTFLPGAPDSQALAEACVLWSVLPLAAGVWKAFNAQTARPRGLTGHFLLAGVMGGVGLSLSTNAQLSVLFGLALGAIASARYARAAKLPSAPPWRLWGLAGCATSLVVYMVGHFPAHMDLRLEGNHPLYAIGWLAGGELLQRLTEWIQTGVRPRETRAWIMGGIALLGLAAVIGVTAIGHANLFSADLSVSRLTRAAGGLVSDNIARWLAVEGASFRFWATVMPAALLLGSCIPIVFRAKPGPRTAVLVLCLGPVLVTLVLAFGMLRWWNTFDTVAIVALATATAALPGTTAGGRLQWALGTAVVAFFGLIQLMPTRASFREDEFSPLEMQALMERDLAHSLAQRRPDAIVLAPPDLTASLWFYGGLRGLASFDVDNRAGFQGALRIAGAPSQQEAWTLLERRGVTHLVLPSWDLAFDEAAKASSNTTKSTFIEQLRHWILPLWLRPLAYYAPPVIGFETKSVALFEVVEEQDEPTLISQMATYFIEAGMPGHATELRKFVRPFSTNMSALIALAEIEALREDQAAFRSALDAVVAAVAGGADRFLPWDRRTALAAILARGNREDLARAQIARCYQQVSEPALRTLTAPSLFRFLALGKRYGLAIDDPNLSKLSLQLLPPESRQRLL